MILLKPFSKAAYLKDYLFMLADPLHVQERVLKKIIRHNKHTRYGKQHGFATIKTIADYQRQVPEITYPDIAPHIERIKKGARNILTKDQVRFFATTSGTTSEPKYIPITRKRLELFRKEFALWKYYVLAHHPDVIRGKTLYFAANQENGKTEAGIPHGNISGYVTYNAPWYIQKKLVIPAKLNNDFDFERKTRAIAKLALLENITQIAFASPVQALIFIDYLHKHQQRLVDRIRATGHRKRAQELQRLIETNRFIPGKIWPNLTLINCIKSETHALYLDQLRQAIGKDITIRDPGIYSSEGRITLGLTKHDAAGIICANESFFEFKEHFGNDRFGEPQTIDKLNKGKTYQVIMTTPEGLYRYNIGDLVTVIDHKGKLPIVRFAGRDKFLNIAEEHAPESEIAASAKAALAQTSITVRSFTVAPYLEDLNEKPRYELLIEPVQTITAKQAKQLSATFDQQLQERILTYAETRNEFGRMQPPIISIVAAGSYADLDKAMIAKAGQAKPVQVTSDHAFRKKLAIKKTYL